MRRSAIAIVNPASGRRSVLGSVDRLRNLLAQHGCRLDIRVTTGAGHATALARACAANTDVVLAVGGDGTFNEVINGLSGQRAPVALWGTGTENLLARELGLAVTPEGVAETLLTGEPTRFDLGTVNGRRFASVVGIGFDAECVQRFSLRRRGNITHWDYFWPIWRTFGAHRFPDIRVDVDGLRVFEGGGLVLIGNIARYSVGLRLLPYARCDDGLLDVCILPCRARRTLVAHAFRAAGRCHVGRGGAVYCHARRVRAESTSDVPFELDGEFGGVLPVTCEILPDALRLLRPSRAAANP